MQQEVYGGHCVLHVLQCWPASCGRVVLLLTMVLHLCKGGGALRRQLQRPLVQPAAMRLQQHTAHCSAQLGTQVHFVRHVCFLVMPRLAAPLAAFTLAVHAARHGGQPWLAMC